MERNNGTEFQWKRSSLKERQFPAWKECGGFNDQKPQKKMKNDISV